MTGIAARLSTERQSASKPVNENQDSPKCSHGPNASNRTQQSANTRFEQREAKRARTGAAKDSPRPNINVNRQQSADLERGREELDAAIKRSEANVRPVCRWQPAEAEGVALKLNDRLNRCPPRKTRLPRIGSSWPSTKDRFGNAAPVDDCCKRRTRKSIASSPSVSGWKRQIRQLDRRIRTRRA